MVSSSDRFRPACAALIGSMSPTMSAMVTSGVASFSTKRESRDSHATGISSPSFKTREWHAAQSDQATQDAALRLAAQSEQDEIVLREDGVDQLRNDRIVVADDAGE